MPKCYGFSLGCKVNAYETRQIIAALMSKGYEESDDPSKSDVVILNTCAVTSTAGQKSRQHIRRFRHLAPQAVLAVMGCYSKEVGEEVLRLGADIVVGTEGRLLLLDAIDRYKKEGKPLCLVNKGRLKEEPYEDLRFLSVPKTVRAYVKIQDGCDKFCSYCAIATLRGPSRSRLPESIFYEVKDLLAKGVKEIVLSGVEIGNYGMDLGDGRYRLGELLNDLLSSFPELERLRVSSLDASEISPSFLEAYRKYPSFMPHFHLSLQSGSLAVLKRMRRHYDPQMYLNALSSLRYIRPETAITTDIIVGFPLESEEEWAETVSFARKAAFADIHVFPFSSRPGTYAATLKEVEPMVKKRRVHELLAVAKELRGDYQRAFYGQKFPVLFETYDEIRQIATGHSPNFLLMKAKTAASPIGKTQFVICGKDTILD